MEGWAGLGRAGGRGQAVPEGVSPLVPAELAADAVGDGGDELAPEAQLRTQLQGKGLWRVLLLRHVPFKLVHQRDVPHVDVQLQRKNTLQSNKKSEYRTSNQTRNQSTEPPIKQEIRVQNLQSNKKPEYRTSN